MSFYIGREASKIWKRFCAEITTEINLLAENWKYLLAGLVCQVLLFSFFVGLRILKVVVFTCGCVGTLLERYKKFSFMLYLHGLAAHGVHYLHKPGPTLQDLGFFLLPELGQDKAYISETLFTTIFVSFFLWTFHPFILKDKKIYTVLIWCRVLSFLVASQALRIVTFYSTQLPGPNYHCREGSELARLPPPKSVLEVLLINFPRGVIYGCGDLIFSSHMIFTLVFVLTYQKYGTRSCIKRLGWLLAVIQSLLIIASRKHYTVDVVVAWYTVNLVVFFVDKKLPEMDRNSAAAALLLPLSIKDNKDGRSKDENHKLLNGNSVDPAEWRQRTQTNGKILENGTAHLADSAMNGA